MTSYEGGCHCGAIRFRVETDAKRVLDCNCSICMKKGFLHLIVTKEQFTLSSGESVLATYSFNTNVAKHHFCRVCGMHPFYVPRSHPDGIDVNVRCLDQGLTGFTIETFDGQNWEANIATIRK